MLMSKLDIKLNLVARAAVVVTSITLSDLFTCLGIMNILEVLSNIASPYKIQVFETNYPRIYLQIGLQMLQVYLLIFDLTFEDIFCDLGVFVKYL